MSRAIGMVEFKTVSTGVTAAELVKAAAVELVRRRRCAPANTLLLSRAI